MTVSATITVEAEFATDVWTAIYSDIRSTSSLRLSRGKCGNSPLDRVASTGSLTFTLDNSTGNSGGLLGYYSPDNANCRAGWELGTRIRLKITYAGTVNYKFLGKVDNIAPVSGQYGERSVGVSAVDYMDELVGHKLDKITAQQTVRGEQLLAAVIANMPNAPIATAYGAGVDTYTRGLHSERDEGTTGMTACQKIAQSGMDDIYITGDLTAGETLVYRSRHERIKTTTVTATFTDTMTGMRIKHAREAVYNRIKTTIYPVQRDTLPVILYALQREISLTPSQVYTFTARYTDPLSSGRRVSGENMITPVADTDYKMSNISGNGGNNLNPSLGINVTFGANSAGVILTNNGTSTGYVNRFNLRGYGLYEYDPVEINGEDSASQILHGDRALNYHMPYQDNPNIGEDFKNYLLTHWKNPHTSVESVEFVANSSDALMTAMLDLDIGKRITVTETVTGVSKDYFVNGYALTIQAGDIIQCILGPLEPADVEQYWLLGIVNYGELDTNTRLGW